MSAFLGPIDNWLYGKIQLQEAIIARIAAEAEAQGWSTGDKPAADYVKEETRPLDELIDTMNIHGWLQGRIHDAEGRYAQLAGAREQVEHRLPRDLELDDPEERFPDPVKRWARFTPLRRGDGLPALCAGNNAQWLPPQINS